MLRNLESWHIVVLAVVVVLLFGSKKLPDAARGLGRSLRIFKSEIKSMQDDDAPAAPSAGTATTQADPPATATDTPRPETPPRVDG